MEIYNLQLTKKEIYEIIPVVSERLANKLIGEIEYHDEHYRTYHREYYRNHKDKLSKKKREYYKKHKKKILEYNKQYRKDHPEKFEKYISNRKIKKSIKK